MAGFIVLMAPASIRGSSNGRTPGFGPGYRGSNPCPRAPKIKDCKCSLLFWVRLEEAGIRTSGERALSESGSASEKGSDAEPELA